MGSDKKDKKHKSDKSKKKHRSRSRSRSRDRKKDKKHRSDSDYRRHRRDSREEEEEKKQEPQQLSKKFVPGEKSQDEIDRIKKLEEKYGVQPKKKEHVPVTYPGITSANPTMIEIVVNDRLGKKEKIKCMPTDTIGDIKKLVAAKTGTRSDKIRLQKWHNIYKDHITLQDYEINNGMSLEMYYN